jgi:hypothetical protein
MAATALGTLAAVITRTWQDEQEYTLSAAEVERLGGARFADLENAVAAAVSH